MPDDIVIRFSVQDDGSPKIERLNQTLGKTKEASKALVPGLESARSSVTGFLSTNAALIGVLVGVGAAAAKAFNKFQDYAGDVRDLAIASGTTAEESSRLLQVMDDFEVTAGDVTNAARALKEKGLVPTVDTLAKLSDQFLAIEDPAERLKFAQDNLGRSASAYYNVLSQGSKVILDSATSTNKMLILTDKQIKDAEQERLAVDALGDAWQGFVVQLGAAVGGIILANDEHTKAIAILREQGVVLGRGVENTDAYAAALAQVRAGQEQVTTATTEGTEITLSAAEADKARDEALQNLSRAFEGLLSSMFSIQSANDNYHKTIEDINRSDQELANKKYDLELAFKREQAAGDATAESFSDYIHALAEVNQAIDENIIKRDEASKDLQKQADQRVFDLAQERLGADGVITSGEFEFLQNLAVQKGLVSQAAADQAIAESRAADDIVNSYMDQADAGMSAADAIIQSYGAVNDTLAETLNLSNAITESFGGSVPATSPSPINGRPGGGRDSGGPGWAGQSYLIGTGAQPEVFTPSTNGFFTPANKMGNTNNLTINIGSIRSEQDIDYLSQEVIKAMTAMK